MSRPRPISSRSQPALRRLLAAAAIVAAVPALAACGGSKSPASGAAGERAKEQQAEAKLAKFAKCMREHGVEATTSSGPGGHGVGIKASGKTGAGRQTLEAAQRACKQYQPEPEKVKLSPQEKVAREEAVLKFAKCMREHGVDVHASTTGDAIQMRIGGPAGGAPNPESPAFKAAQKACQGLLPFKGKGPPGTGPQTSASGGVKGSGADLSVAPAPAGS